MMKTVIYDATILTSAANKNSNRSGIFFTAYNIALELKNNKNIKLMFYCEPGLMDVLKSAIKTCMPEFLNIPFHDLQGRFKPGTCFLSPVFKVPDIIENKNNIYKYTLLYDSMPFLFPEYFPAIADENVWIWRLRKLMMRNSHDKYFSISNCTKQDWLKLVPQLKSNQIIVTPLAANSNFYHETNKTKIKQIRTKYGIPNNKKYVFSLCTLEPRKNLIRAVKTFIEFIKQNKIDDIVFVLGGAHWNVFIGKLESEIKDLGKYKDKIIRAGYIDDEDLAPLYSGAEWFVYTSQYEGFGLPPLEAMKCGCPVITSNNSSLPEVVGNAAQMIDWDSDAQHIAAYKKYYFDEKYRQSMAKRGLEHSNVFSWEKTVDIMIQDFQKQKGTKMKLSKLFGIKTTKHSTYYRCYFLWLPYMKIKYAHSVTKIYLFGIQIAHVKTICEAKQPCIAHNIVAPQEEAVLNQRALEIITKHQDSDYTKVAK